METIMVAELEFLARGISEQLIDDPLRGKYFIVSDGKLEKEYEPIHYIENMILLFATQSKLSKSKQRKIDYLLDGLLWLNSLLYKYNFSPRYIQLRKFSKEIYDKLMKIDPNDL